MIAVLFLLLCCSPAYGHELEVEPPWVQNRIDIEQLEREAKRHAPREWVQAQGGKLEKIQESQAYTMAYIKIALGILGFAILSLSGLLAYVLRRLFRLQES
jgi:hypothetical protein